MRITKIITCSLLLICIPVGTVSAQESESNVPEWPFAWFSAVYEMESGFEDEFGPVEDAEADLFNLDLKFPVFMKNAKLTDEPGDPSLTTLINLQGIYDKISFCEFEREDLDLYSILLPVEYYYTKSEWLFNVNINPGIFSDFENVDGDDYSVYGSMLLGYRINPSCQFFGGISYDDHFGEEELYPLAGVIWDISREWQMSLILPYPQITYAPSEDLAFYVNVEPAGGLWNVNDEFVEEDYDFELEGYRAGFGVDYHMSRKLWVQAQAGYVTARKYEFRDFEDNTFEADVDDTAYVKLSFLLR
jgi:hypothetical protein